MPSHQIPNRVSAEAAFRQDPYYKYRRLEEGCIRLIKICDLPQLAKYSGADHQISISMFTFPVGSCPSYDALSYTWGSPVLYDTTAYDPFTQVERCYPIYCEGRVIRGTYNLRAVLRRLRQLQSLNPDEAASLPKGDVLIEQRYGKSGFYWIDALSINQDDIQERSAQVMLMARIYREAQATIIWLGEQDNYSSTALEKMLRFSENFSPDGIATNINMRTGKLDTLAALDIKGATALFVFFKRRWFQRLWILQEAVLARNLIGLCGTRIFSFDIVLITAQLISNQSEFAYLYGSATLSEKADKSVQAAVNERQHFPSAKLSTMANCRKTIERGELPDFPTIMSLASGSQTSEPRDHIYGILALTTELLVNAKRKVKPDYGAPVLQVFMDATKAIVLNRGDLKALSFNCDQAIKQVQDLPSWCPDFSVTGFDAVRTCVKSFLDSGRAMWTLGDLWRSPPEISFASDRLLAVKGFWYDTIQFLTSGHSGTTTVSVSDLLRLALNCRRGGNHTHPTPVQSHVEQLCRLFLFDEFQFEQPASQVAKLFFPAIFVFLFESIHAESLHTEFLYSIGEAQQIPLSHEQTQAMIAELNEMEDVVSELIESQPDSAFFLPDLKKVRASTMKLLEQLRRREATSYPGSPLMEILSAIEQQAFSAGLSSSLSRCLDGLQASPNRSMDLRIFMLFKQYTLSEIIVNRHLFNFFSTSRNLLLGVSYHTLVPGDQIWLLNGAPAPFVLRPRPNGNFEFKGEVYIQGIMRGEARREDAIDGEDRAIYIE